MLTAVQGKGLDAIRGAPGAKTLIALETGTIVTPRMELMFEGIGRRRNLVLS